MYAVKNIPAKFLIDKDGNMVGKFDTDELSDKLKSLLGFWILFSGISDFRPTHSTLYLHGKKDEKKSEEDTYDVGDMTNEEQPSSTTSEELNEKNNEFLERQ